MRESKSEQTREGAQDNLTSRRASERQGGGRGTLWLHGQEMFSHIGSVLPSSLSEFSKTITNSIASQLNISRSINPAAAKDTEEEDADAPPEIDVDVLLSYYARLGEHRPCSRLLRERMFEHSNKGPRSATLLVPGSPTFERPWR